MADRHNPNEDGVSEVVGSVLLIALVVLAVAIVAVTLFSQPHVVEVPHASIVAGNSSNGSFVLFHEGGDPLRKGEYRIYVDTGTGLEDRTAAFNLTSNDSLWSIGEALTYTGPGTPTRVVVLAGDSAGGETVIAEPAYTAAAGDTGGYVDAGGAGTVVTPTPGPTTSPIMIVGPEIETDYVIDMGQDFNFAVNLSTLAAKYVHMVIYNYNVLNGDNKGEIESKIIALNLTPSEANNFYYNHTLKTTNDLGGSGDRISVTAIAYDTNDTVLASESVLGTLI